MKFPGGFEPFDEPFKKWFGVKAVSSSFSTDTKVNGRELTISSASMSSVRKT